MSHEKNEYEDFFRFAPEMLCIVGSDGLLQAASLSWEEALGVSPDELRGTPVAALVHPDDRETWLASMAELRGGAKVVSRRLRFRRKGEQADEYRLFSWSASLRAGREQIYAVAHDITDVDGELRRFKSLAEATTDYIGFGIARGTLVYVNPAGMALLGRAGQDFRTLRPQERLTARTIERVYAEVNPKLMSEGQWTGELEFLHASGEVIPVSVAIVLVRDAMGRPEVSATIAHDLREQKRNEAFLRQFKAMSDAAPSMISISKMDTSIDYINPAGLELVGRTGVDLRTINSLDFMPPRVLEQAQNEIYPALLRDGVWAGESEMPHVDGTLIPIFRSVVLIRNADGEPDSFAAIVHDLRVQKRLEEALRQSIREMATPIIQVWDGVLALPVIGLVDSARAAQMTEALLDRIVRERCRVAILDLTGVDTIDTSTVNHLFKMVSAASLLGSRCVISGISSSVAQTIAHLGLDLSSLRTFRSLQEALRFAAWHPERPVP